MKHFLLTTLCMMNAAMSAADQKVLTTPTAIHQNMRNELQKDQIYVMPSEDEPHEGTWLQWPHNNGWDRRHVQRYEESWIQMAQALHKGERVHVIVYNAPHMSRVQTLLRRRGLDMSKLDFWIQPTDDVWIRDNGPIFVRDENDNLLVENYGFNGWGGKADYLNDDKVPIRVARGLGLPRLDVAMVNEGGSFEVDGRGTLMAKKSSILNPNRNPGMTQADAEAIFRKYLGVTNFIWLKGERGIDLTDDHVDGTARFAGNNTIVTLYKDDFSNPSEYDVLVKARNANGKPYTIVHLPITSKTILNSGVEGIYVNYYVGNDVVLVPTYNDPMDRKALQILGRVYPSRQVVGINMEQVYVDGGAVHCVTQQQPAAMTR